MLFFAARGSAGLENIPHVASKKKFVSLLVIVCFLSHQSQMLLQKSDELGLSSGVGSRVHFRGGAGSFTIVCRGRDIFHGSPHRSASVQSFFTPFTCHLLSY